MEQPLARGLRIRAEIPCQEVNWSLVRSVLSARFHHSGQQAGRAISGFNRKIASAMNIEWFSGAKLGETESQIVASICEVHGADSLTLTSSRVLRRGGVGVEFKQRVEFEPPFLRKGKGEPARRLSCLAEVDIDLCGRSLRVRRLWQALLAHSMFFCLAVLTYVIVAFCLLYAASVFLMFVLTPDIVTIAATRRADIGLGLLAFMVVLAWVSGRAVSNLSSLFLGWLRRASR